MYIGITLNTQKTQTKKKKKRKKSIRNYWALENHLTDVKTLNKYL